MATKTIFSIKKIQNIPAGTKRPFPTENVSRIPLNLYVPAHVCLEQTDRLTNESITLLPAKPGQTHLRLRVSTKMIKLPIQYRNLA